MKIGGTNNVTMDAKVNYESILKARDWAVANGIDYPMTSKHLVSGYDVQSQ